ncbi:MAG: hypothetical protein GY861_23475 [bacterium]|nr:hypothetical protein [bacterium]
MFWFHEDERKRLFEILRDTVRDESEFEHMFQQLEKSREELSRSQIEASVAESTLKGEVNHLLVQAKRMFSDDVQLVHLLLELRKKGLIDFVGVEQKDRFSEIIAIAEDLLKKSEDLVRFYEMLNEKYGKGPKGKKGFKIEKSLEELKDEFNVINAYKNRLKMLIESEERDIHEIENDLRTGLSISEKKLFEVKDGSFRVELHLNYTTIPYGSTLNMQKTFPAGLLLFDHDYLVAEIALSAFENKQVFVTVSETYVKGRGYVQRAIELLLKSKKISTWNSDTGGVISGPAHRLYDRIASNPEFIVDRGAENRIRVRLHSK